MTRFYFNGKSCREFGIYVSGSGTFNAPELDVTSYEIPGRNGDLVISNNRYKNIQVVYPAFIRSHFRANAAKARAWLLKPEGYCRLSDDYNPHEFRMARFVGPIDFDMRFMNRGGECALAFDCKPQRFLFSGEEKREFEEPATIWNETAFDAKPLITVYGSGAGQITIGDTTVSFSDISDYVTLDCDIQDAYKGTLNKNSTMTGSFPVLHPGENVIAFSGGVTKIDIIPRWWTL